jgi:hypothetical protein
MRRLLIQSSCQSERRENRLCRNDYRSPCAHPIGDPCTAKPQPAAILGMTIRRARSGAGRKLPVCLNAQLSKKRFARRSRGIYAETMSSLHNT